MDAHCRQVLTKRVSDPSFWCVPTRTETARGQQFFRDVSEEVRKDSHEEVDLVPTSYVSIYTRSTLSQRIIAGFPLTHLSYVLCFCKHDFSRRACDNITALVGASLC